MSYRDGIEVLRAAFPELASALSACTNLDRAIRYLSTNQAFLLSAMDVIAQDEFTHDVLIPFAQSEKYLVLGST
ncbi:MAG: hypothetical protein U0103_13615 [Candidatus Obscuribacterales bacterium]